MKRRPWPLDRDLAWPELPAGLSLGGGGVPGTLQAGQLGAWQEATGRWFPEPAPKQLIPEHEERRLRAALAQLSPAKRRAGSVPAWPRRRPVAPAPGARYCRAPAESNGQGAQSARPNRGGTTMANNSERPSGPKLAEQVLEKADRPVHVKLIAERVLSQDRKLPKAQRRYKGATPEQTISAALTVSSNGGGTFVKTQPGVFALRSWPASKRNKSPELPEATKASRQAAPAGNGSGKRGSSRGSGKAAGSSQKSGGSKGAGKRGGKRPTGVDPEVAKHSEVISEGRGAEAEQGEPAAA